MTRQFWRKHWSNLHSRHQLLKNRNKRTEKIKTQKSYMTASELLVSKHWKNFTNIIRCRSFEKRSGEPCGTSQQVSCIETKIIRISYKILLGQAIERTLLEKPLGKKRRDEGIRIPQFNWEVLISNVMTSTTVQNSRRKTEGEEKTRYVKNRLNDTARRHNCQEDKKNNTWKD